MEWDVKPCSIYLSCCPALMNLQHLHLQSVSLLHLCKFASRAVIMRKTGVWTDIISTTHTRVQAFNGPLSSAISWAICKSAPRSRQTTKPAPHHSVFYRPDALPATQPTASKHWKKVQGKISKTTPRHLSRVTTIASMIGRVSECACTAIAVGWCRRHWSGNWRMFWQH